MNSVILIGRLVRDPDVRYSSSQMAVARFTLAVDRGGKDKDGNDRGADFPGIVAFGKTAELVERYLCKGLMVAIQGRIQTSSYEKDGRTIYKTEVMADRVKFLEWPNDKKQSPPSEGEQQSMPQANIPEGFSALTDDDIPF